VFQIVGAFGLIVTCRTTRRGLAGSVSGRGRPHALLNAAIRRVDGRSGEQVRLMVDDGTGVRSVEGTDLLIAAGRTPNTGGIGLDKAGVALTSTISGSCATT
jgi:pyruvate/2-oxoglutarate dehydrogenase complex dihydrolipoamide dehydrogenase (E3) component